MGTWEDITRSASCQGDQADVHHRVPPSTRPHTMPPKSPSSPGPVANGAGGGKVAATSTRDRAAMRDLADGAHDERGEFEDAWEDEFEEEDVQSDDEDDIVKASTGTRPQSLPSSGTLPKTLASPPR